MVSDFCLTITVVHLKRFAMFEILTCIWNVLQWLWCIWNVLQCLRYLRLARKLTKIKFKKIIIIMVSSKTLFINRHENNFLWKSQKLKTDMGAGFFDSTLFQALPTPFLHNVSTNLQWLRECFYTQKIFSPEFHVLAENPHAYINYCSS